MGLYAPNVYLLTNRESALIDTGLDNPRALAWRLEYIKEKAAGRLKYIFITHSHPDHLGGVIFLKKALGIPFLVAHEFEEDRIRRVLGNNMLTHLVKDGERIPLGDWEIQIIHTPGHCRGHVCYFVQEKGILFSGDHVPGVGTTIIIPPRGDMSLYLDSLRRLCRLPLEVICPGHGPLLKLQAREVEVEELIREIYPELDTRLKEMDRGQILAHLIKLKKEGKVNHRGLKWKRENTIH